MGKIRKSKQRKEKLRKDNRKQNGNIFAKRKNNNGKKSKKFRSTYRGREKIIFERRKGRIKFTDR
jgi:hypothetical protein